jgi:hypothetical protein
MSVALPAGQLLLRNNGGLVAPAFEAEAGSVVRRSPDQVIP